MATSVHSRTLQRLVELLGTRTELARTLGVSEDDLGNWIADRAKLPAPIFAKAVDVLLDETATPGDDTEPGEGSAPRDCTSGDASGTWY